MSEEGSGILSGDAVERGRACLFQSLDGACVSDVTAAPCCLAQERRDARNFPSSDGIPLTSTARSWSIPDLTEEAVEAWHARRPENGAASRNTPLWCKAGINEPCIFTPRPSRHGPWSGIG